jgi:hypothetical protein
MSCTAGWQKPPSSATNRKTVYAPGSMEWLAEQKKSG